MKRFINLDELVKKLKATAEDSDNLDFVGGLNFAIKMATKTMDIFEVEKNKKNH